VVLSFHSTIEGSKPGIEAYCVLQKVFDTFQFAEKFLMAFKDMLDFILLEFMGCGEWSN